MSRLRVVVALVGAWVASAQVVQAGPVVVDPGGSVAGKTIGQWTADWWNHVVSVPGGQDIVSDPDGAVQSNGQTGPVYFAGGQSSSSTGSFTRSFSVPAGKHILLPLVNTIVSNGPDPNFSSTAEEADAFTTQAVKLNTLFATVDGVAVSNLASHREVSPVNFTLNAVDNNLLGLPGGTYTDANSDGHWLMLKPLSPGNHTIHFGGSTDAFEIAPDFSVPGFSIDVTDHITVGQAVPLPAAFVPGLGILIVLVGGHLVRARQVRLAARTV